MRWTGELRLTCAAQTYGEVVWFGRRGAGVKLAIRSAGDGGKRAVLREEHEVSRKAIAQGRPECSRCPVCSCALLFAQIARETAGAASTRSSLRPLIFGGRELSSKPRTQCAARSRSRIQFVARMSAATSGDHSDTAPDIAALIRATSNKLDCFAALAMTLSNKSRPQITTGGKRHAHASSPQRLPLAASFVAAGGTGASL